jgi:hypothetical protein
MAFTKRADLVSPAAAIPAPGIYWQVDQNCPAPVFNHLLKCLLVQAARRRAVLAGNFQILAELTCNCHRISFPKEPPFPRRTNCWPLGEAGEFIQTFSLSRIALNEQESAPTIPDPKQS